MNAHTPPDVETRIAELWTHIGMAPNPRGASTATQTALQPVEALPAPTLPAPSPEPALALNGRQCAWPLTCGEGAEEGKPYCGHHRAVLTRGRKAG